MAEAPYTSSLLSADLALFDFQSAEDLTPRKLAARFRVKMAKVHPDKPDGDAEQAKALTAARDRLQGWDGKGRPRPVEPKPEGPFAGFADTAAAAQARAAAREAEARREQGRRDSQENLKGAELEAARRAANRIFFWRRARRWAFMPLRLVGWGFALLPVDLVPLPVVALLVVFGWPFLQDSSYGRYVPRLPSVYEWFKNTEAIRWAQTGGRGPWVNPGLQRRYVP